jgi:ABC-type branched-subunit amino acid transport system ATPase component
MRLGINRVVKKFGNLAAVNDCTIELESDGIFGLVGPNGSGKTTLFNVISGFLRPDQGSIVYGQKKISKKSPSSIAKLGIARTFQLPRVFSNLTVQENLEASGLGESKKTQELMEVFNLKDIRNSPAGSISYGQKKQLELARVLSMNPSLLLLDEPTSGLEPALVRTTVNQIKYVRELGKSIFIIEHNMNVIMNLAEKIFVLHNGKKIAEGTPGEVKTNDLVVDAYLGGSPGEEVE